MSHSGTKRTAPKRGERQASRSREAIKRAFETLLAEKGYGAVTVGEITERADVGRSTFYRHFPGKPDVLVALHEDMFNILFLNSDAPMDWLAVEPSRALEIFLERHSKTGGPDVSLGADVGVDVDYIMRNMVGLLSTYVARGLAQAFPGRQSTIPLAVLGSSVAGIYSMVIMSWKLTYPEVSAADMARYVHRQTRAIVREAFATEAAE